MSATWFLIGAFTGASCIALWALCALRDWHYTQQAKLTDAERRAYASGYEQAVADQKKTSTLRARMRTGALNAIALPLLGLIPEGLAVAIIMAGACAIGISIAYILDRLSNQEPAPSAIYDRPYPHLGRSAGAVEGTWLQSLPQAVLAAPPDPHARPPPLYPG